MTQPAGWYGDPQDPTQQRYWDGAFWTEHRRPAPVPPMPPPYPQGFGYAPMVPSTPDGVPLSGWWKRVGARILDSIIVMIVGLPLTGYFWFKGMQVVLDYQRRVIDDAVAGRTSQPSLGLPAEAYQWLIPAQLIAFVVSFAYEYFFLTRSGATPGKRLVDISVRLRDVPGPPTGSTVVKRWGLVAALSLPSMIPIIGSLVGIAGLINYLWPLWDSKKQAWHDKFAATNVVVGPQVRRS